MNLKEKYYPESRIGGFSDIDGTIAFFTHVNALINPSSIIVDVGCGRGAYLDDPIKYRLDLRLLRGKSARIYGVDPDPASAGNPNIDEFRLITNDNWPIDSAFADLILADYVLEHIQYPDKFFSEANRILKPGGVICIRTSNVLSYFGIFAKLVPNQSHFQVLRKVKYHANDRDIFPTYFRCNTVLKVKNSLAKSGFDPVVYGFNAEPSYLSFSVFFYYLGVLYQRYMPGMFKVGIHAFGKKLASGSD
jgi:SAM-dependent methyltransferase